MLLQPILLAALASASYAALFVTSPVASTTCRGNSNCTISWQDDNTLPRLASYGNCHVGLWTGSAQQQTEAHSFGSFSVANKSSISVNIPASAGPDGSFYFIRFNSAQNTSLVAFSAKFALEKMTGNLTAAAAAQINATTPAVSTPKASVPNSAALAATTSSAAPSASANATNSRNSTTSGAEELSVRYGTAAAVAGVVMLYAF